MRFVFAATLLTCAVLAFYYATRIFYNKNYKYRLNRLFSWDALGSGIWSLGFGLLYLQTDPQMAYYCRSAGLLGVFLYLMTSLILINYISGISKKISFVLNLFGGLGFFLWVFLIAPGQTVYYWTDKGMLYYFKPTVANNLYTVYSVLIAVACVVVTVTMFRKKNPKRLNRFGFYFLTMEILLMVGMTLDTIFPLIGLDVIPGSSLLQYGGIMVLYRAVHAIRRNMVNTSNMAEYVYNTLDTPILVFDKEQKLRIVNNAAKQFFLVEAPKVENGDYAVAYLFKNIQDSFWDFEGDFVKKEARTVEKDIPCNLSIDKIYDQYGDLMGYIVVVNDMTEHVAAMERLDQARIEADAASRTKTAFLANMSHEIRTPMNAIVGFAELALQEDISTEVREYIEDVRLSSQTLLALINEVLDISKIESGKMELECVDYYPSAIFREVIAIVGSQAQNKGLDFKVKIASNMPKILRGDKVRIREILINLLNNAVKYTPKGTVEFEADYEEVNTDEIRMIYRIKDSGIGIREDQKETIFEAFSRVDLKKNREVEGTGLGLPITKKFVEMMDGTLTVESEYGKGSVFTAQFIQKVIDAKPIEMDMADTRDSLNVYSLGDKIYANYKVLVVDDNAVNRKVISKGLAHYGLDVDMATGGMEAIEKCKQKAYDIVFMDQMMPEMDGVETMKHIRENIEGYQKGSSCKIIALTANVISGTREELLKEGFDDYLGKPINYRMLESLLDNYSK